MTRIEVGCSRALAQSDNAPLIRLMELIKHEIDVTDPAFLAGIEAKLSHPPTPTPSSSGPSPTSPPSKGGQDGSEGGEGGSSQCISPFPIRLSAELGTAFSV